MKQKELDLFEQQVLTDLFGGYTSDYLVFQRGIFKLNISNKVQEMITTFEDFIKPYMNEYGLVDGERLNNVIQVKYISIPNYTFRLVDIYKDVRPLFLTLKERLLS